MRTPGVAAVLRRLAASGRQDLILRGSVLLQVWCPFRPAQDLDLLATFPFDVESTVEVLRSVCTLGARDGVELEVTGHDVIFSETAFPGVRATLEVRSSMEPFWVQVDVGFGDPQVVPPAPVEIAGVEVLACRPETLLGWKLHALYERGKGAWRPKDLHDAYLLLKHAPLDPSLLGRSIHLAYASRGDDVQLLSRLRDGTFGRSDWSRHKWTKFRASRVGGSVPETPEPVVAALSTLLQRLWPELTGTQQ